MGKSKYTKKLEHTELNELKETDKIGKVSEILGQNLFRIELANESDGHGTINMISIMPQKFRDQIWISRSIIYNIKFLFKRYLCNRNTFG